MLDAAGAPLDAEPPRSSSSELCSPSSSSPDSLSLRQAQLDQSRKRQQISSRVNGFLLALASQFLPLESLNLAVFVIVQQLREHSGIVLIDVLGIPDQTPQDTDMPLTFFSGSEARRMRRKPFKLVSISAL